MPQWFAVAEISSPGGAYKLHVSLVVFNYLTCLAIQHWLNCYMVIDDPVQLIL